MTTTGESRPSPARGHHLLSAQSPAVGNASVDTGDGVDRAGRIGRRDVLPITISVFQFAVAIGATIAASDVDPVAALVGAAILSAGASQLAGIELLDAGVGVMVATSTALLINVRFVVYGAGFARWFASAPRWQRYAMIFPIVDQSYLLCERRFADHESLIWRRRYYLAVVSTLFAGFAAGQLVGYFAGDLIPERAGIHMAGPITFAGLLALATTRSAEVSAALAAGSAMVIVVSAPHGLGLPIAAAIGLSTGAWSSARPNDVSS